MVPDADMKVWLDTAARTRPGMVVPYVESTYTRQVRYKVRAVQEHGNQRAVIGQQGSLRLAANVPAALSSMSLSPTTSGRCEIEITLSEPGVAVRRYVFDCPA